MTVNSRSKGKRGELEFAAFLESQGIEARRGIQFRGGEDSPDVIHNLPGVHFEVKRTERLALLPAIEQATDDAGIGRVPVVVWRRNRGEWIAILRAADLVDMVRSRTG